jgi:hypothetical protein
MSSYEGIAPEPKKLFLAQLLADDQLSGHLFIDARYLECVKLMWWIVVRILDVGVPKTKAEPLYQKLDNWIESFTASVKEIKEARKELATLLSDNFYGEMHLGLIQTSSLEATKAKPKNEPISPELSSKL